MATAPGQVTDALATHADLLPTFCEAAGAESPADVAGGSLLSLTDGRRERLRDVLFGNIEDIHMVRDGDFKYIYYATDGAEQLFDARNDPDDLHDLAAEADRCQPYRRGLVEHLRDIRHPHMVDGGLLNRGRRRPDDLAGLRAVNPLGWASSARGLDWDGTV